MSAPLLLAAAAQARLLACITERSVDAWEALGQAVVKELQDVQLEQLLALRGLLACDLLLHGLQRRHLVDYGRNRWAAAAAGGRSLPALTSLLRAACCPSRPLLAATPLGLD